MTTKQKRRNARIIDLAFEYYGLRHKIDELQVQADALKVEILQLASPGRYGRYAVIKIAKARIEVRAYTRAGFTSIRKCKQ